MIHYHQPKPSTLSNLVTPRLDTTTQILQLAHISARTLSKHTTRRFLPESYLVQSLYPRNCTPFDPLISWSTLERRSNASSTAVVKSSQCPKPFATILVSCTTPRSYSRWNLPIEPAITLLVSHATFPFRSAT